MPKYRSLQYKNRRKIGKQKWKISGVKISFPSQIVCAKKIKLSLSYLVFYDIKALTVFYVN